MMASRWFDSPYFRAVAAVVVKCPRCGLRCDTAASMRLQATPRDGDLSVCCGCGAVSRWADGATRIVSADESALDEADRVNIANARAMIAARRG